MKGAASADAPSVRTRARWSKPRSPSFAAVAERGPRLVTTTPVLVLPGYGDSGPEHWQSLWQAEDPACRRVVQRDWMLPRLEDWLDTLARHVAECEGPPVLVAHSLACSLVAHWVTRSEGGVKGALLVAPADVDSPAHTPEEVRDFSPFLSCAFRSRASWWRAAMIRSRRSLAPRSSRGPGAAASWCSSGPGTSTPTRASACGRRVECS